MAQPRRGVSGALAAATALSDNTQPFHGLKAIRCYVNLRMVEKPLNDPNFLLRNSSVHTCLL
jgi:hypothetical protein